jgi:integrase
VAAALTRLGLGTAAIRSAVSSLRVFYAWAADEDLIEGNPARRVPVPGKSRTVPRPVSEQDLATAVAAAPPRIRVWLILGAWAGLRANEIALLRRENVLDTAEQPALVVAIPTTKGQRRERVIPLSPFVVAELHRAGLPKAGYLFTRRDGEAGPNTRRGCRSCAASTCMSAGSPRPCTPCGTVLVPRPIRAVSTCAWCRSYWVTRRLR